MNKKLVERWAEEIEEEISFSDILANLTIHSELTITIPLEEEPNVKLGLKNLKAKQNKKLLEEGITPEDATLEFSSVKSKNFEDCLELTIFLKKKGVIKIKGGMRIPDNTL